VSAYPTWDQLDAAYTFDDYEHHFRKVYDSEDDRQVRKGIFEARLQDVLTHNADAAHTWKKGVNHFSDRHDHERRIRGVDKSLLHHQRKVLALTAAPPANVSSIDHLPSSMDWRKQDVVTPVKNQVKAHFLLFFPFL